MFSLNAANNNNNNRKKKPMKIRCDVCDKAEASIFCSADEAALCDGCDRHVHHANKLASKHLRFSLVRPSSKQSPLCDICQERRAFLFCQEDRAILCRECDIPIHKANEHKKKHNRFLLTGVKLSTSCSFYPSSSSSPSSANSRCETNMKSPQLLYLHNNNNNPTFSGEIFSPPTVERASSSSSIPYKNNVDDDISISTSSISEYLETIPGWCVDDFLDPSIEAATDIFSKTNSDSHSVSTVMMTTDQQLHQCHQMISFSPEDYIGLWVPEEVTVRLKESKEAKSNGIVNRNWTIEDIFTVPEIGNRPFKISRH